MYECPHEDCDKSYKQKRDLEEHLRGKKHDPNKLLALKCDQCTDTFRNRCQVQMHKRRVHDKAKPKFKCDHPECNYTTDQSNNLTRHTRAVHQGIKNKFKRKPCPLCGTELNETDIARHIRESCPFGDHIRHSCRFGCGNTYATETGRDDHEYALHHLSRPWVCKRCGKDYSYRSNLYTHRC